MIRAELREVDKSHVDGAVRRADKSHVHGGAAADLIGGGLTKGEAMSAKARATREKDAMIRAELRGVDAGGISREPSYPHTPPRPSPPLSPLSPLSPPPAMWITREALAEAGKCLAQNGQRQPVRIDTFVCVGGGSGGGGGGSHSASKAQPDPEEQGACEFVPWPLDPLSGALLPFSAEHAHDIPGSGGAVSILSVVGDACYAAATLAAWVKEDARVRGEWARVALPASGAAVHSRLLFRAATLGGEVALDTLMKYAR
jgi:hypothetical protein